MESVPLWKMEDEEVEIFTPEEKSILLANAPASPQMTAFRKVNGIST
jgi:hypothetical protein